MEQKDGPFTFCGHVANMVLIFFLLWKFCTIGHHAVMARLFISILFVIPASLTKFEGCSTYMVEQGI